MLIAHTQNENKTNEVQSLFEHAIHVGKYIEHMLADIGLGKMGYLIGILHDLGKAAPDWQLWVNGDSNSHPSHSQYGRVLYNENIFQINDENSEDFRFIVANVILGHHSNLFDAVDDNQIDIFRQNFDTKSLEEALYKWACDNSEHDVSVFHDFLSELNITRADFDVLVEQSYREFNKWVKTSRAHLSAIDAPHDEQRFAFYKSFLQMLLLSCLNDADTLDTQRHYDNIKFSYEIATEWEPYVRDIEDKVRSFKQVREIDEIRKRISDACYEDAFKIEEVPSIKRLSAPTGCGKTLCSTRYAFSYAYTNSKRKVFYIIPFTTIIDQNAQVICDLLEDSSGVLVHHSNVIAENREEKANVTTSKKDSGVRYDEDVILTTQVQFLDGIFGFSRASNKLFCRYVNSIVVFDEFQSMPEKVIDLFYVLIDFMAQTMRCNIVLCSATQAMSLNVSNETELISGIDWEEEYRGKFRRTVYVDETSYDKEGKSVDEVIGNSVSNSESILVIANTKRQAEEAFLSVEMKYGDNEDVDVFYLSTNMYMNHRKEILAKIKTSLELSRITVLISTSLVEAGIDISFQNCARYENGLDHVIQAGGRCNRNGEWDTGTVYIIREPEGVKSRGYQDQQAALQAALRQARQEEKEIENTLETYYQEHLKRIGRETKYKTRYGTLFDLLSIGDPEYVESEELKALWGETPCLPPNRSRIRTVRELFHTIDDKDQIPVFIAIEEKAQELLNAFMNAHNYKQLSNIQKQMQQYSVNVYSTQKSIVQQMNQASNEILDTAILYVDSEYLYNPKIGLSTSGLGDIGAIVL